MPQGRFVSPVLCYHGIKTNFNKLEQAGGMSSKEKYSEAILQINEDMERYFEYLEIESDYLINLLSKTIGKIVQSGFQKDLFFGSIIEGNTIAGGVAELTGDHCIRINSHQLKQYEENVAMALLAHELAHDHLQHFKNWENSLENEHSADNLARQWGFNIDRFRKISGPPRINSRLLQIAIIN